MAIFLFDTQSYLSMSHLIISTEGAHRIGAHKDKDKDKYKDFKDPTCAIFSRIKYDTGMLPSSLMLFFVKKKNEERA